MRDGQMHQTTLRFGPDLWAALEGECARLGVSVAQYVREAALARLAYTAAVRGDQEYAEALAAVGVLAPTEAAAHHPAASPALFNAVPVPFGAAPEPYGAQSRGVIAAAEENRSDATALGAQNTLAIQRAREIRAQSRTLRQSTRAGGSR
jgi:hypothetical protein